MKSFLGVEPTSSPPPSKGIVVTMEGTNLLITIILGLIGLLAVLTKATTKFNRISEQIRDLNQLIETHQQQEGHEKLLAQVRVLQKESMNIDKIVGIHLQDYVNYKDATLLHIRGCEEQIDHKWKRAEEEFAKDRAEIKDLKGFLIKNLHFKVRGE